MFSKKTVIVTLAAAGLFGAAALTRDVDIHLKDAWAAPACPSSKPRRPHNR